MSQTSFSSLKLDPRLLKNIASLGYKAMTPIQEKSLPPILEGKDVIAQAKTGSGKTAAFSLRLLEQLDAKHFQVQSLVLCPTRELADQVAKEIRNLARLIHNIKILTLCGGMPLKPQTSSLEHGVHIIVGTPGRIEKHLRKGSLKLDHLKILVLDEADRMLDMGFEPSLAAINEHMPTSRQTLLFSATFTNEILAIAEQIMHQPMTIQVDSTHESTTIEQHFFTVDETTSRTTALRLLLLNDKPESTLVFCNTKTECKNVANELKHHGFDALALHGDLEQRERDQTLVRFINKSASILVATDVASRGLDIETLSAVINYDIAHENESHVHRIGRTGRAGNRGIAYTLCSGNDVKKMILLEAYLNKTITTEPLPASSLLKSLPYQAEMTTLLIDGGKKQKVRPGDILGALTGDGGISGKQVGKIHIFDNRAYVAVTREAANAAVKKLEKGKLKGRSFRIWRI